MVVGLFKFSTQGAKVLGKSRNGISVTREVLKDGSVVTKSFKEGKLFKTITQGQEKYLEPGVNWNSANPVSYLEKWTTVKNYQTGDVVNITKKIHKDGTTDWHSARPGKEARTLILKGKKIIEDMIEKYQSGGGYLSVKKRPYISVDKPSRVIANNYKMPNGKIVNGEWGRDYSNIFGIKPQSYSVKIGDTYYSGNKNFEIFDRRYGSNKPIN